MFRNIEKVVKSESLEKNKMKSERNEHKSHELTIADVEQSIQLLTESVERLPSIFEKYEERKKMYESKADKSRNVENDSDGKLDETFKKPKEAFGQIPNDIVNLEASKHQPASLNNPASAYEPLKQEKKLPQWKKALKNKLIEIGHKKMKSYWKSDMGQKKREDHMKKVESELLKTKTIPSANRQQELRKSRGAYGPSLGYGIPPPSTGSTSSGSATTSGGSSSGAVAVFTNAKDGNCGIPFKLLSCSPSVESGTLSTTSSYIAPTYSEH